MFRRLIRPAGKQVIFRCNGQRKVHLSSTNFNEDEEREKLLQELEPEFQHPIKRTVNIFRRDFRVMKRDMMFWKKKEIPEPWSEDSMEIFPYTCDVVIIGGGAIGSSIAYFLKERARKDFRVVVIEKDPTYKECSSALSVGGLRQQFSLAENIEMSLFGAEFIRNANQLLGIEGEPPIDLGFHPNGYLFVANNEKAEVLQKNSELQNELGARNILLSPNQLKRRFPWLNVDDVALGCLGIEKEGWFDPWLLLSALKRKAASYGAEYIHGKVEGFLFQDMQSIQISGCQDPFYSRLDKLMVRTADGKLRRVQFAVCIIAAGAQSGEIAKMARIGKGRGMLSVPLPVEPRKRYVYSFHSPGGPGINTPLTIDTSGTYFRREGLAEHFICGKSPEADEEPSPKDLTVDDDFFHEKIWPCLAHRVKSFENLKMKSSWAGYYEYNTFDANGIIGVHPYYFNLYFATGFSGHGIQQAPAVGRAISELILDSGFETLELRRLGFDRFITLEPMLEMNIV